MPGKPKWVSHPGFGRPRLAVKKPRSSWRILGLRLTWLLSLALVFAAACGDDEEDGDIAPGQPCELGADPDPCEPGSTCLDDGEGEGICLIDEGAACNNPDESYCADGLTCEEKTDGTFACYPPVTIAGMVFDASDDSAIEGAQVIALDDFQTAVSDVAVTDAAGNYGLRVPVVRNDDGSPAPEQRFTLRSSATDYQTFPGGVRTALPVSATEAVEGVIDTPITDIAMVPLPSDQQGQPKITGAVSGTNAAGVLVVAETNGGGYSAITDKAGNFTIFNVPDGSYEVRGYAAGLQIVPESVTVDGADVADVVLGLSEEALGTIEGSVNIVNAPGNSATSVVLVTASTYDDTFVKGEVGRGLRAPLSGPPTIDGSFTIEGVPAGNYVVLASFENDDLVRDPDPNISGTQIVNVTVERPGQTISLESFKVTEALAVIGPGADEPEAVTGTPTLRWADDSSEDFYSVVVYDSFGDLVWEEGMVPSVSGGDEVSVTYGGPTLESGMYYQFRATSWRQSGNQPAGPISTTEDLRGVFYVE